MISNSIQELFDGTLGDEQTAELLHALSVNPEKRTDFRRHMALQGAMHRDRVASGLTSDEDDAIWGVIAGVGGAATVGGAAANYAGGFAKVLTFLLVGVAGYMLGSGTPSDIFGSDNRQSPPAAAPATTTAPPTGTETTPARPGTQASPLSGSASSTIVHEQTSANDGRQAIATAAPTVIYRDRVVYRDRQEPSRDDASGSAGMTDGASLQQPASIPANTPRSQPMRSAEKPDMNGSDAKRNAPAELLPADSAQHPAEAIAKHPPLRPIDPAEAFRRSDEPTAFNEENTISALWKNGFELSYGEYVGMLSGDLVADDVVDHDPNYSSRHLDITYRVLDGRFGFGARVGYGTFSRVSLYLDHSVRTDTRGSINRIDSVYRVRVQPEKQTLTEFFVNYRLPVLDRLGLGLEASWGRSPVHMKAGGSLIVHWLLTDHIGLQAGGGLSRYWYSYVGEQREKLLQEGGEGTSISDKAADSYAGTSLEARYGIFYHF